MIFLNFFLPSASGGSRLRKSSKKIEKFSNFQKCPKTSPKASKQVLNMFGGDFFEKKFAQCTQEGRNLEKTQKNQEIFKFSKMSKNVPKCVQTCFKHVWRCFFFEKNFAQCTQEGRNLEKNSKKKLKYKINFLFEYHGGSRIKKKSKNFQIFKNVQKRSQKSPDLFEHVYR